MSKCAICSAPMILIHPALQGYVTTSKYDVYECNNCALSCVYPLEEISEIYRWIYESGERVKGYERYWRLATVIHQSSNPAREICRNDAVYEFVLRTLREDPRKELKIAEIGSGLGYLTYCIRQSGYDATGFDVSDASVSRACSLFGPHYRVGRLEDHSTPEEYDYIICTEVLEHVSDPLALLASMKAVMSDHAKLLISTPDKNAFPRGTVWETESPPVHLWWFTRQSLRVLAERAGLSVDFVDTAGYVRPQFVKAKRPFSEPDREAVFGPDGFLLEASTRTHGVGGRVRAFVQESSLLEPVRRLRRRFQRALGFRPYSICAVMQVSHLNLKEPTVTDESKI
jgi:SAM-dependent methyltransferase